MKSSPGLNSLQVVVLTLGQLNTCSSGTSWDWSCWVRRWCSLEVDTRMFTSSAARQRWWHLMEVVCAARRRGHCVVCLCGFALTHKHTHTHHASMLRRVQHIRRDGRRKASQDQRVNWLLSPEAEAIRVFRVPRSQSPASPRRLPPDPWTRSTPF